VINNIKQIAVIGAGLMGHGIAQVFAAKGFEVNLVDITEDFLEKAIAMVQGNLEMMSQKGLLLREDVQAAIKRITITTDMRQAVSKADFVVEAIVEKLEVKQKTFKELDGICPENTILATNTSVISISEIAEKSMRKQRIVGTHFWNPPYLIPLVEVVRGKETSDATINATFKLLQAVGKHPVRVNKDVPGFVANRLQHALWREAIYIVERSRCAAEKKLKSVYNSCDCPILGIYKQRSLR